MIARFRYCPLATLLALWRSLGWATGWRFDFLILSKSRTQHLAGCPIHGRIVDKSGFLAAAGRSEALGEATESTSSIPPPMHG